MTNESHNIYSIAELVILEYKRMNNQVLNSSCLDNFRLKTVLSV